jgi:hypothetical protein
MELHSSTVLTEKGAMGGSPYLRAEDSMDQLPTSGQYQSSKHMGGLSTPITSPPFEDPPFQPPTIPPPPMDQHYEIPSIPPPPMDEHFELPTIPPPPHQ